MCSTRDSTNHTNSTKTQLAPAPTPSQPPRRPNSVDSNQNPHPPYKPPTRAPSGSTSSTQRTTDHELPKLQTPPPLPNKRKQSIRFDWGSEVTVYIGQRLEGADEVPVLAHPELVCLHGDRAAATASPSFWRDLARGKKNATVPTNSSYRRSPTARWSRLICGGGGRRRGGVNRGVRAGLRLRLSGRIGFLRRSRRCNILLLGAMRALLRLPVAAAWARGGFGCSPGWWGPPRQRLEISCLDHSKKKPTGPAVAPEKNQRLVSTKRPPLQSNK